MLDFSYELGEAVGQRPQVGIVVFPQPSPDL
jgi:hypothetical protein